MTLPPSNPRTAPTPPEENPAGALKSPPPQDSDRALPPRDREREPEAPPPSDVGQAGLIKQAAPSDPSGKASSQAFTLLVTLRDLSAEMLDFQDVLSKVRLGEASLDTFNPYIVKTVKDVDELVKDIQKLGKDPSASDSIRHILNAWEQMKANPLMLAPDGDHDAQQQLHYLNILDRQIEKVVFLCGSLTIPNRLNTWLQTTRPGYYIPFHTVFEDEIPNPEDRQRLLEHLATAPEAVQNGWVDSDAGLIYRYSQKLLERWLSVVYFVLALGLSTGLVVGACYLGLPDWPLAAANLTTMLSGWLALLAGIIVHIGIGSIKRKQERSLPAQTPLSDILFIVNARLGQILLKLFIALIGFFGLVFASGIDQATIFNSFLVGYSLDSFVEVFGTQLEQRAAGMIGAAQKNLTG